MDVSFPYLEGFELASGSEKGWAINAAKLFSLLGHDVHIGNSPLEEGLIADIMYLPSRIDFREDQTAWNFYKNKARKFLFGVFNPIESQYRANIPRDSILVTPFRACGTECFVLPYAYYQERPCPDHSRNTIGWVVRNPFDFYGQNIPLLQTHLNHLKVCKKLVDTGCSLIVFSNHTYTDVRADAPRGVVEAREILDGLCNSPRVTVADHLSYSQYLDLLKKTSIVLPLDGLGSTTEALKVGSLPLNWDIPVNIYDTLPNGKRYTSLTYGDIDGTLSRLVSDEKFYYEEYNTRLGRAAVYSLEEALRLVSIILEA